MTDIPGELRIQTTRDPGVLTLALRGELDLASAPALKRELSDALASGAERVVVDLRELEYMDSSGLLVLLDAHQRLREDGHARLFLRSGQPNIQRFFELTSTDSVFQFETPEGKDAAAPKRR